MITNVVSAVITLALLVIVLHPSTPTGWRTLAGIALGVGLFILIAKTLANRG